MQTIIQKLDLDQMSAIYHQYMPEAFPPDEVKPFHRIEEMYKEDVYGGYGLFEEGHISMEEILAYGFYVRNPQSGDLLLDYLAVPADKRGEGYGSRFLKHLPDMMQDAELVLIEIEHPDKAGEDEVRQVRESRRSFYIRNNVQMSKVSSCVFGVEYQILQFHKDAITLPDTDVHARLDAIYHIMFPEKWIGKEAVIYPPVS